MRILVAAKYVSGETREGGSSRFMKLVSDTLKKMGHTVDITDKPERFVNEYYDLIICSHILEEVNKNPAHKISISHGTIEDERMKRGADTYIAISEEIKEFNAKRGFESRVIPQPIFIGKQSKPNKTLKNVLIIRRYSVKDDPFAFLKEKYNLKISNPDIPIEDQIAWADICITLGRGALESMAQGKPVLIADNRDYIGAYGDGYVNQDNISEIAKNNFSGRRFKHKITRKWIESELSKYSADDSDFLYNYIAENHDAKKVVSQYLEVLKTLNIHLVIPFYRQNNKNNLIEAYRPMRAILHPIMFQDEETKWDEPWIEPVVIPMDSKDCEGIPSNVKRNYFIRNCKIMDDDYYVTVDDDDMYEPGVFDEIKKMDDDIVIISMKRGHNIPQGVGKLRRYCTNTLKAHPDNIQIGDISGQQSFVKGRIFKEHLFDELSGTWDGEIAVHHKKSGEKIAYRPDLYALFNFYEPGRWEKNIKYSFGVLINDIIRFDMVLRQSELPGDLRYVKNPESATKGLNQLLNIMAGEQVDVAILTHQDMYYRNGWLARVKEQLAKLPDSWVVAGIIGKDLQGRIAGRFRDMRIPLHFNTSHIHDFPVPACCFDECCIIVNMKSGFRFDEKLDGFDLYGTLCVLQTWEMGGSAWVIDAAAEHYCLRPFTWHPDKRFSRNYKWLYKRFKKIASRIDSTAIGWERKNVRFETSARLDDEGESRVSRRPDQPTGTQERIKAADRSLSSYHAAFFFALNKQGGNGNGSTSKRECRKGYVWQRNGCQHQGMVDVGIFAGHDRNHGVRGYDQEVCGCGRG